MLIKDTRMGKLRKCIVIYVVTLFLFSKTNAVVSLCNMQYGSRWINEKSFPGN